MSYVPKLWCVKLIRKLKSNPRQLQAVAKNLGLEKEFEPTVVPNTPSFNEELIKLGDLIYIQPLVIAPNKYPYADHPFLAPNGVFYPSEDKLLAIHHKYGDTSQFIDFPSETPPSIMAEILSKYEQIFSQINDR